MLSFGWLQSFCKQLIYFLRVPFAITVMKSDVPEPNLACPVYQQTRWHTFNLVQLGDFSFRVENDFEVDWKAPHEFMRVGRFMIQIHSNNHKPT
jgi:hypothetical protein